MNRMSKPVRFITIGLAIFGGITMFVLFMANVVIDCADSILRRVTSPDGTYNAEIFQKDCQSTKTQELHFGIEKEDSSSRQTMVLGSMITTDLELSWISPTKLEIIYPHNVALPQDSRDRFPFFEDIWVSFRQKSNQ